ncbi:MAG: hypothetical protein ACE5PV_18455 [Candidatus Poribacteria bacterium]
MNSLELSGKNIKARLNKNLSMTVLRSDGSVLWESSKTHTPTIVVRANNTSSRALSLASAKKVSISHFDDGKYRGHTVRLSGFGGIDVVLELSFAIDAYVDEFLIQAAQVGGIDAVESVSHLYRFEKPVTDGGYMILPHGSGYLVPAECPDELPGKGLRGGLIGGRWSMPLFGMVRGDNAMCIIVETWWDCDVTADHLPGDLSALDFNWIGSLGKLTYPRRFVLRFAQGMDYVAMAKLYREYAQKQGLLRTIEEKAAETPVIRQYIENILLRWAAWNSEDGPTVLSDIRRLQKMGFGINFFFPKWSSAGYSPERGTATTANANWQAYLLSNPVPGGWESLAEFANAIHQLGCTIQGFVNPRSQDAEGPEFDENRWPHNAEGQPIHDLSSHDALERTKRVLDGIEAKGLKYDVLYYDGYSAHHPLPEDFSRSHPQTRRRTYEAQNACFAETRHRGIMPGAELARFWCMADCDYFFFTDWSSDRLSNAPVQGAPAAVGEPIPLFQLVFHDCYIAGFSGGGYALYSPGYDWWEDRTPRLYELLFASAPAHNWLPEGYAPIRDWDSEKARRRWTWLKRWNSYYRTIAASEMISHRFLSSDRKQQRIEFVNGATAEFNMATNELLVKGVAGFSGDWERPDF